MIGSNRIHHTARHNRRVGQTLIELIVSMTLATMLMLGLGSCLLIASSAFDGSLIAAKNSRSADVLADMMTDLNQAKAFTSRSSDSVTFTVPDRNNDGSDETLTYAWTGMPAAELTYAVNGAPPVTILQDVQRLDLTYLDRFMIGETPALPVLAPDEWGQRWQTGSRFGNETVYPYTADNQREQIGTRVTLTESGTLQSLSAYFTLLVPGQGSDVRLAIYDTDAVNVPNNLLTSTDVVTISATGWVTAGTAPIPLSPGEYYLALSVQNTSNVVFHYESGTGETHTRNRDAVRHGFTNPWGPSNNLYPIRTSIYATYDIQ